MKLAACSSLLVLVFSSVTFGQIKSPAGATAATQNAAIPSLGQLDQISRQTVMDLGRVRVDKWKADGNTKDQARGNIDSLQKNLTAALPGLIQQVQSNPSSVAAAVKLYHNLNVVYDVLANVAESTGAFGSKDDYQALATDVSNLENVRRTIADQVEQMAAAQDTAYAQLQQQIRAQQQAAAAAATPAKKVIVDENEPAKKSTSKKKKAAAPSSTATSSNPK